MISVTVCSVHGLDHNLSNRDQRFLVPDVFCVTRLGKQGRMLDVRSTYSRSECHDSHVLAETARSLELDETLDSACIFDPVAEELTEYLHLLAGKEGRRQLSDDLREVSDGLGADCSVLIVDVLPKGLYDINEGDLFCFKFYPAISVSLHRWGASHVLVAAAWAIWTAPCLSVSMVSK